MSKNFCDISEILQSRIMNFPSIKMSVLCNIWIKKGLEVGELDYSLKIPSVPLIQSHHKKKFTMFTHQA